MKRKLSALAYALVFTAATAQSANPDGSRGSWPDRPVGTWRVAVTFTDCAGNAVRLPFQSIDSFAEGGTFTEFGVGSGNLRSVGLGSWHRTGPAPTPLPSSSSSSSRRGSSCFER